MLKTAVISSLACASLGVLLWWAFAITAADCADLNLGADGPGVAAAAVAAGVLISLVVRAFPGTRHLAPAMAIAGVFFSSCGFIAVEFVRGMGCLD